MKTYLGSLVDPTGWLAWKSKSSLSTLFYAEYKNFGPGSAVGKRVKWPGYRNTMSPTAAAKFSVGSFIAGKSWLPATGVPYTTGL